MRAEKRLASGKDIAVITGVRVATPANAFRDTELEIAETMSGRERAPLELAPADDAIESVLPVPEGVLFGGKYTVERIFAEGGMGIVCLGRHMDLDQVVAIKFLRRALSGRPTVVQRFLNEARALAALRSEHTVRVMDVGQLESGRPYLVMEHLDGIHLQALLERDGPLSVETAVGYVLQVCEPLAEAHALGIVHRDIKPENLFLWSGGPTADSVKVLDFGLAKQLGSSRALGVTGPQDSLGSPGYMSPEQVTTPQAIDSRTDIWSLGCVLYQLLTNVSPFEGGSLVEVLSHVLKATPASLPQVVPGLDLELDAIVQRCLEKAPEARYQTMGQLADALNAYLAERHRVLESPGRDTAKRPIARAAKLRIAGVHSRGPALIVALVVAVCAAFYAADRSGLVRLRNLTDGWLTHATLGVDAQSLTHERLYDPLPPFSRGLVTVGRAHEVNGAPALPAALEHERAVPFAASAPEAEQTPMSDEERQRRQAGYRDYLKREGLTPLSEASP